MFPLRSMSGRIQGFGGRILSANSKAAKYLNSPESPIYHKSKVLYGLFESKKSIVTSDCCYIVEGYTDVIQMHQSGITNVVSASGTALTVEQIRMIRRLTSNVVVLFDGDAAGLRASLRGVDLILEAGMHVKVCVFPEGEDPDSFCKARPQEEIEDYLNTKAQDFIQFKAALLLEDAAADPSAKAAVVREIVNSIAKIPDAIARELYVQRCADLLQVSENVLFSTLAQLLSQHTPKRSRQPEPPTNMEVVPQKETTKTAVSRSYELERQIISLLLQFGGLVVDFEDVILVENKEGALVEQAKIISAKVYEKIFLDLQQDEIEFTDQNFRVLYEAIIKMYQKEGSLQTDRLFTEDDTVFNATISDLLMADERYQLHDWERRNIYVKQSDSDVARQVSETILSLRRLLIDQKIKELQGHTSDSLAEMHQEHLEDIKGYLALRSLVTKKLDRVF
jgi:DNA primase